MTRLSLNIFRKFQFSAILAWLNWPQNLQMTVHIKQQNESRSNIYHGIRTFIMPLQFVTEATKKQIEGIRTWSVSSFLNMEEECQELLILHKEHFILHSILISETSHVQMLTHWLYSLMCFRLLFNASGQMKGYDLKLWQNHLISRSPFNNHPIIYCYIVWTNDGEVKWAKN